MQAFFENLLPEGELRLYLSERHKASTLFAQLREVAGDTAGALAKVWESAANEAIIMRAAAHCGLATAKVATSR